MKTKAVLKFVAIFLGIAGILLALLMPKLNRARISANEGSAIQTIRVLYAIQNHFQSQCLVDQNRNGVGEYGYFQELTGVALLRGKNVKADPLRSPKKWDS